MEMLLLLIPIAWLAVMTVVVSVCCMAARGDRTIILSRELGDSQSSAAPSVATTPAAAPRSILAA
jgi:hypothetical protein